MAKFDQHICHQHNNDRYDPNNHNHSWNSIATTGNTGIYICSHCKYLRVDSSYGFAGQAYFSPIASYTKV